MESNKSKIKRMIEYLDEKLNTYEEEFIDDRYHTLQEVRNEFSLILAVDKKILEKPNMFVSERIRKMTIEEIRPKYKRKSNCSNCNKFLNQNTYFTSDLCDECLDKSFYNNKENLTENCKTK